MDIRSIKRDSAAAAAGQWVGGIPGMADVRLRVRGLGSPTVVAIRARKERRVGWGDRETDGSLKPDVAVRILGEVLHEAVLLDWEGFTDGGQPVTYSADLAEKWLTDPDYSDFADAVVYAARVADRGAAEVQDKTEKNSARPSTGRSGSAASTGA